MTRARRPARARPPERPPLTPSPPIITQEHTAAVTEFLSGREPARLFAYLDGDALAVTSAVPPSGWSKLLAFVRDPSVPVVPAKMTAAVHFTLVNADLASSLLGVMQSVYAPAVLRNRRWPESVRKELAAQMHRFLASLTERSHELKGKTVLYIPDERVEDVDAAAEEKDLVQRLESTVIHWTRQIRDVVNELESSAGEFEEEGPLQELEYWNARAVDLAGIRAQLSEPGMGGIVRVLERVKSVYLPPFLTLWEAINREAAAAEENAKFLSALAEPCGALARAGAKDVAPLLPGILHRVRLIWNTSQNYNVPERICGLLRKISGRSSRGARKTSTSRRSSSATWRRRRRHSAIPSPPERRGRPTTTSRARR